jgi:hypothetical protein
MLQFSVESKGNLKSRLEQRIQRWRGETVAARIQVPPDLKWWYWNEFGTATKFSIPSTSTPGATIRPQPGQMKTGYYEIDPVQAEALRFPQNGQIVFRDQVDHPGLKPSRSVTKMLPSIAQRSQRAAAEAFHNGAADHPGALGQSLVAAAESAKQYICYAYDGDLGTRALEPSHGRLGGSTAAADFDSRAKVVDVSTVKG